MGVLDAPGALDGTDASGVTPPSGGLGLRGWLSGIYNRLASQATAAKQPAPGTAGSPSSDVITVQGIAAGTAQAVAGDVAAGAADSGSPVKGGGKYNATLPTYADGQRGDVQLTTRGATVVTLADTTGNLAALPSNSSDAVGAGTRGPAAISYPYLLNGASFDRQRNNEAATVRASTADSANFNSTDQVNYNGLGATIYVNVSAVNAGTLVVKLQGKDPVSGTYYDIPGATTGSLSATGLVAIIIHPGTAGTPAAGSAICSLPLPRTWRAVGTITGTSVTSSIGAHYHRGV